MAEQSNSYRYFDLLAVDETNYLDDSGDGYYVADFGFLSDGLILSNQSSTSGEIIQFSFDGTTTHGELDPDQPTAALAYNTRREYRVYFKLKTAGSAVTVHVEAW